MSKPWIVKGDEVGYISDEDDQSYGMFCPLAIVHNEKDRHLFAAAPELVESCERLLRECQWEAMRADIVTTEAKEDMAFARAAIAKARGES